jgi:cytochrome P450 family 110
MSSTTTITPPTATAAPLTARLPPGSRHRLVATLDYLRDPYRHLLVSARRYGDPYTMPSFLGPMVATWDPPVLQSLLAADPDTYGAVGAELMGPVVGFNGLILLSGERHRAMRKLVTPPFHGARMRTYGALIAQTAQQHIDRWPRDRAFDVHPTMQAISLDVILKAVLGLEDRERRETVRAAILGLMGALKPSFLFLRWLRRPFGGLGPWARFQRATARVADLFNAELERRRADPRPREDILSLLMEARYEDGSALSDQELHEQMMTLIGAGHETTASALAFALHHIHADPAVEGELRAELGKLPEGPLDPQAVAALPYLDAVCSETLRLDPIAPLIGRTLRKPLTLKGYQLPPGVLVGIDILNVHRRPDLYPDPDRFRPQRFLERRFGPHEYLPFGGGSRRCLGAAFATYEMKLVLATVMRQHQLRPASRRPLRVALRNTTVGPASGVHLRIVDPTQAATRAGAGTASAVADDSGVRARSMGA